MEMGKAATYMRKIWLAQKTRRRYLDLKKQFKGVEGDIITIQRYMRGCLCRLKMWREAVRAEEEIWGCVTMQRLWRGYLGRVRWETEYETMWRRETSSVVIARHTRGWLARLRVSRKKRTLARATFESARRRYQACQKIQALTRGVQTRKITSRRRDRVRQAAIAIQRIQRGRRLRGKLWEQIVVQRATMIQAAARRFLVRNRRFHLIVKVICVQRNYRRWLSVVPSRRAEKIDWKRKRKDKAIIIQKAFREFASRKKVKRIQAKTAGATSAIQPL
jgi:hypothetical protein